MTTWTPIEEVNDKSSISWAESSVNKIVNSDESGAEAFVVETSDSIEGAIASIDVVESGSTYSSAPTVTVSGPGEATAVVLNGEVTSIDITVPGSDYTSEPTVTIDGPGNAVSFNNGSNIDDANDFITTVHTFTDDDRVYYTSTGAVTAVGGLQFDTEYYVSSANSSGFKVASTLGGAAIDLTGAADETADHQIDGVAATASATISEGTNKGYHSGIVLRTEGTGGRAGRVQTETLVASGSNLGDGS